MYHLPPVWWTTFRLRCLYVSWCEGLIWWRRILQLMSFPCSWLYITHFFLKLINSQVFLAATKQLYHWFSPSVRSWVCLSVCPSVTPFSPCSHHRIFMKFSGVITMYRSDVHANGQCQRWKVKVIEVNTQLSRFRTLTPVWIHIWQWNRAHSWKQPRRGALLFFKVIRQISRSHGFKNRRIWARLGVSGL